MPPSSCDCLAPMFFFFQRSVFCCSDSLHNHLSVFFSFLFFETSAVRALF
eukprot:m.103016 g.103016  ORF g.103016 m.103016 type:complete len:50 (+) comp14134_c1_seq1:1151-1300(+)